MSLFNLNDSSSILKGNWTLIKSIPTTISEDSFWNVLVSLFYFFQN